MSIAPLNVLGGRNEEAPLVAPELEVIVDKSRSGLGTLLLDFSNVFKAFIGTNFLSLPYAIAVSSWYNAAGMVTSGGLCLDRSDAFLVFTQYGFCIGYMVFLATNVGLLLPKSTPVWATFLIPVPYLVPIAFIKHVKQLSIFSFIADAFLVFSMVMFYRYDNLAKHDDVTHGVEWHTLPVFFGMAISSYEGIGLVLPIEESMSETPNRFPRLLIGTLLFVSVLLSSFGLLGYLTYGKNVCAVLSKNLPSTGVEATLLKIALLIAVLFTYPLQLVPVMDVSEKFMFRMPATNYFEFQRNVWRTLLVLSTAAVAYLVPFFGLLASLIGALGSASLAFIIPCILHMRVFNRSLKWWQMTIDVAVVIFGVLALVLGTFLSIKAIVDEFAHTGVSDVCNVHS